MIAKKSLLIIVFLIILIFLSLIKYFDWQNKNLAEKFYPNVYIDGVNYGKTTKSQVKNLYQKTAGELEKVNLFILYKNEEIATFSAQKLNLHSNSSLVIDQAYSISRSPSITKRFYEIITTLFNLRHYFFYSQINYDKTIINEFINFAEDHYNKPAKNALLKFENGRVINFRTEEPGLKILSNDLISNIEKEINKLDKTPKDIKINLTDTVVEPEITLAKANQFGIEEPIGEGKSDFSHSIPERIHNIILASSKFNGVLIPKDKIFSFNETVGDISPLTGYKPAYIIKEGKTVLGDGGGVCQVSTTLFRAALNSGLPIIERYPHAYRVGYYENDSKPGLDATVFAPSVDLKVKNDTPAYILIQTQVDKDNNLLFFEFYGKKDGRKIEISPVQVFDVVPPLPAKYQDYPTLKKGVVKQVDFPAWGGKAKFDYNVFKNGETIFKKTFFSSYRPWQAIFLVGTAD